MANNWKHTGTTRTVTKGELGGIIPFTAGMNAVIDEITLRLAMTGTVSGSAVAHIVDGKNNVISKMVTINSIGATPSNYTLTGLNAQVFNTFTYFLVIAAAPPPQDDTHMPGVHHQASPTTYSQVFTVSDYQIAAGSWVITSTAGKGFPIGGYAGYQPSGDGYRSLDIGITPVDAGYIDISSIDSVNYPLTIDLYHTSSSVLYAAAGVAGWTKITAIQSGDSVPAARYWRAHIQMQSSSNLDQSPVLHQLALYFDGAPMVFATQQTRTDYADGSVSLDGVPVVDSVSSVSAQMTPAVQSVMRGRVSVTMTDDARVAPLLSAPLIGRSAAIKIGYSDIADRLTIFRGAVEDMLWDGKKYTLRISDNFKFADVSVPHQDTWPPYKSIADYAINQFVTHKYYTYKAVVANGPATASVTEPGTNGSVWLQITFPKIYGPSTNNGLPWHLADIALDLLRNELNVPDHRINQTSFHAIKDARPNRTGSRTFTKPEKVLPLLAEIAWLLEAQWIETAAGLSIIMEPRASDAALEWIDDNDIRQGSWGYRRGWKEMANECLIYSQWNGTDYASVVASVDATSVAAYRLTQQKIGHDKWSMPEDEIKAVADSVVARWANGRRVIQLIGHIRLIRLEAGDRVDLSSSLLPSSDPQKIPCMVLRKDIDWAQQTLKFTLMEVA